MRKDFVFIVAGLMLVCCNFSSDKGCVKGIVVDATVNTVALVVNGKDTLSFGTQNVDKADLNKVLRGDSIEIGFVGEYKAGMEAVSLMRIAREEWDECIHLFRNGIRMEMTGEDHSPIYAIFSNDSSTAVIISPVDGAKDVLYRRTLPSGEHVWNIEDDDAKNLRFIDGCWTISQRGILKYKQLQSDSDDSLGVWKEVCFEGVFSEENGEYVKYRLLIRHREYSGDGYFLLQSVHVDGDANDEYCCMGKRYTQRGIPVDNNAIVWQLVGDDGARYNFVYDSKKESLRLLNGNFKLVELESNWMLRKVGA